MRSREIGLTLAAVLVAAPPAWAWGNRLSHQRLFNASVEGPSTQDALDRLLRVGLGVRDGSESRLLVQLGFDDEIDEEIGPAGGKGSRELLGRRPGRSREPLGAIRSV